MTSQSELRKAITDQIVEALKAGGLPPWRRPWGGDRNAGHPTNVASGRPYTGVNPMLLNLAAGLRGFRGKHWGTFNQWQRLGGTVRRRPAEVPPGRWATTVVLYKPVCRTETDADTGEEREVRFGFLKTFSVFCIDQVEGDHLDHLRVADGPAGDVAVDYEPAWAAFRATGADIRFGGDRAYYARPAGGGGGGADYIQCPHRHQFAEEREFHATLGHELVHWSEPRLGWAGSYAEGELRAEIGACYLLGELGVPDSTDLSNHHAYVGHWIKALEDDHRLIFTAAAAASRAADYILSFSRPAGQPDPATQPAAA